MLTYHQPEYPPTFTWQWRHNERDGVSNHQLHDCLLNRLFRRRSKKLQSSASMDFVRGIHRWPVNSPHKRPVTRKMFPFDDVIMIPDKVYLNSEAINTQVVYGIYPSKITITSPRGQCHKCWIYFSQVCPSMHRLSKDATRKYNLGPPYMQSVYEPICWIVTDRNNTVLNYIPQVASISMA